MSERDPNANDPILGASDAEALEALIDASYELDAVPADLRDRARRVGELLNLVGTAHHDTGDPASDDALVAATVLAVDRHAASRGSDSEPALSSFDADALDALAFAGFDAARVPSALRERASRHADVAALLTHSVVAQETSPDLTERTLAAVQAEIDRSEHAMQLDGRRGPGFAWREIISVAAMVLIAASVVLPITSQARHMGQTAACASNLASAAAGFGEYMNDFDDRLPVATAGFGSRAAPVSSWWNVGKPAESNAANLYHLVPTGYASLEDLACPGNADAQTSPASPDARDFASLRAVSFSYRLPTASMRFAAPDASGVVLADRSPVILAAASGRAVDPFADSPNHNARGQHVLMGDGSVDWIRRATLENGDNIWLPRNIEIQVRRLAAAQGITLKGRELADEEDDVFLGP